MTQNLSHLLGCNENNGESLCQGTETWSKGVSGIRQKGEEMALLNLKALWQNRDLWALARSTSLLKAAK